ncbi:MAG: hypothetical protein SGPRY_006210, partial [Prymnesium sp.]
WGLSLPAAPCQAWQNLKDEWREFPPSCECLAECQAMNQRVAYVDRCVNASQLALRPKGAQQRYPFVDPFSNGAWMQQAYAPHPKRGPFRSEEELSRLNIELARRLHADALRSHTLGNCSGRGIFTLVMPWKLAPAGRRRSVREGGVCRRERESCERNPHGVEACHCFPGWFGEQCEHGPGSPRMPEPKHFCVKGCSARGVCKLNWCHCVPGTWGIDCSLGTPDRELVRQLSTSSPQPHSSAPLASAGGEGSFGAARWSEHMMEVARVELPPQQPSLRIYVYDLPPQYNIWLAAHFREPGRWDQSYLYSLDAKIHRWLLRSPYRTLDPESADYFFIPTYLSQGFYDFEYGLYWLIPRGTSFLQQAMTYVRTTWPYFNRSGGSDHILVMTNDKGATFIRGAVRDLRKVCLITQWGWNRPHIHARNLDIVVPPMLKIDKLIAHSPYRFGASFDITPKEYKYLLSFIGSVRFHTPGYSMSTSCSAWQGVRQKIFRMFNSTERFFLRDLRGDSKRGPHKRMDPQEYLEVLKTSRFCLAPSGMGFSTRTYESIAQVHLIVLLCNLSDDPVSNTTVDQAFEELLPWSKFSLRLKQDDIPHLPRILEAFPEADLSNLRRNLACVWPRILWLQADNEAPGQQLVGEGSSRARHLSMLGDDAKLVSYDAWESVISTLMRRVARRNGQQLLGKEKDHRHVPAFVASSEVALSSHRQTRGQLQPAVHFVELANFAFSTSHPLTGPLLEVRENSAPLPCTVSEP